MEAAKAEAATYRLWETDLTGFGLKVSPHAVKTYFVWYRAGEGRSAARREYTFARHGEMTPDEARDQAAKVLARARLGADPQANGEAFETAPTSKMKLRRAPAAVIFDLGGLLFDTEAL